MLQWPWRWFTSGSSDFIMVVNWLKTRRDRDVLQHQKPKECWKSKQNDSIKQVIDYWGNFWGSEHLLWFHSKHFNNRFEHEASEYKIRSTCFDGQTKATVFINFIGVVWLCHFRFQLFRKCHHRRWNLGLWLWTWD